jgi:hypothetical protein
MTAKKKLTNLSKKAISATKASTVKGGNRGQAEKRLSDHRNEMRRNWAP